MEKQTKIPANSSEIATTRILKIRKQDLIELIEQLIEISTSLNADPVIRSEAED